MNLTTQQIMTQELETMVVEVTNRIVPFDDNALEIENHIWALDRQLPMGSDNALRNRLEIVRRKWGAAKMNHTRRA